MRAYLAQTGMELRLTARRGENVLVTLVIPLLLLLFFASLNLFPGSSKPVDFLLPGILALAIMSAGMVSLGIATAYERHYGVLKRLGGSPLSRGALIAAKITSIVALEAVQGVLLVGVAVLAFGWTTNGSLPWAVVVALLGTTTFAGLGLLMAGALRAEATLAGANGLFLVFALIGGVFLPIDHLPAAVAAVSRYLPVTALADLLRAALGGGSLPGFSLVVLVLWTAAIVALTVRTFRWE
ncbi:MAG TPA: ABC transporter permease [Chloroflexota bacterium]|nr:ABC transporter permease [Chloroflexota bacterium]